jgi:hypothetical protein
MPKIAENITLEEKGDMVIITMNHKKDLGLTKSGKNTKIASTNGNIPVSIGGKVVRLGINFFRS